MKYQHRVLGMLSLLAVITYLDRVCIAVAGPRMQDALDISPEAWGWVTSVFFLSYSAFEIPTGALGNRVGPRRVLTRIVAWWSAFTALTGIVSNYSVLLVVRFCFGAGEAGAYPKHPRSSAAGFPPRSAPRLGHRVDDQPGRRRAVAAAGRADPDALRLAGALLRVRLRGRGVERGWSAWFRDSPHEKAGVSEAELREIASLPRATAPRHAMGDGAAHRRRYGASPPSAPATSTRWDSSRRGCRPTW